MWEYCKELKTNKNKKTMKETDETFIPINGAKQKENFKKWKSTKEMIAVMQHYIGGGDVEAEINSEWLSVDSPDWNWRDEDYRCAADYEPFNTGDWEELLGKEIRLNGETILVRIDGIGKNGVFASNEHISFEVLLHEYTFKNWGRCGKPNLGVTYESFTVADIDKLLGRLVYPKGSEVGMEIISINRTGCGITNKPMLYMADFETLLKDFVFGDGSPCGKVV